MGASCKTLDDCKVGTVCGANSKCEQKGCSTYLDCGNNEVCLENGYCSKPECGNETVCPSGKQCQGGVCKSEQKTCTSNAECSGGEVCKSGVCTGANTCATKADCQAGQTCKGGSCTNVSVSEPCSTSNDCGVGQYCDTTSGKCASGCNQDTDCSSTQYCDTTTNQCKSGCQTSTGCSDGRECDASTHTCKCTQAYCAANGGGTCDTVTGECVTVVTGDLCKACTSNDQCGDANYLCSKISKGSFCTKACTKQSDCPSGYFCYEVTTDSKQCVPSTWKCIGCIQTGCSDSTKACNFNTGECETKKKTCEACTQNFECGDGSFCLLNNSTGTRYCAPGCNTGSCPNGFTCNTQGGGDGSVKVCEPNGGTCSLCSGVTCGGSTPVCKPETGKCVECVESTDCSDNKTCDVAQNKCIEGNPCAPPLPIYLNGKCVECVFNNDCTGGTCVNNVCQGGQSGGSCQKDTDCGSIVLGIDAVFTNPALVSSCQPDQTGFNFECPTQCDTASGLCFSLAGLCDDQNSFCAPGSQCVKSGGVVGACACSLFDITPKCFAGQTCNFDIAGGLFGGTLYSCGPAN
ncbi:MAG: hypothetical protein KC609_24265 [Myxococcales bacterium]|nr:hypothetical protein [Myxococcales bacterium]